LPWEDTEDFIRSGHRNPEEFEPDSLRTITLSEEEGIKAVIGKPKGKKTTEVVSYLFSKEKGWTLEKAKEWFKTRQAKAKESFSWAGSIKEVYGTSNLIRGKALHPLRTVHPEEWPEVREYLEEELQKAAHSLREKPLILDHYKPIRGKVLGAEYEDGAIEYVAQLNDPTIMRQIVNGDIKHCSVEFEWKTLENVNGVAPRGIVFTGLSLLKDFEPGDPLTTVEVWEAVIKQLKEAGIAKEQAEPQEFIFYQIRDPAAFLQEHFSTAWIDQTNGIQGIYGRLSEDPENPQLMALLFMKAKGWNPEKMRDWLNNHPQYLKAPSELAAVGIQPIQQAEEKLGKKKPLGEAIIGSSEPPSSDFISKQEVLNLLPEDWIVRAWSYGPQLLVRQLRHRLESRSSGNGDRE
jgi:hypothetical protein